ncbi:hypothetical protein RclHR1_07290013 [Rhizophagus clarus]|uniref:Uncharacterized protein n=1 Tax=Rhizophagus clarus TaxID=94130 RepID=A0A2Z6RY21_9GLOM|nr:hypothetical protein RclHR1_07290013 [Rhizophagus clarus]
MAYGENSNPEHSKYQKMAAYLRISALNCSFMYQVALRVMDHAYRIHLLSSHPDDDSEDGTDTDIDINIIEDS